MAFKVWNWDENRTLIGKLTVKIPHMRPYGKALYGVEQDNGSLEHIWGTKKLVGFLAPLPFFTKIKIVYLGMGKDTPQDVHDMKLFEVTILDLPKRGKKAEKLAQSLAKLKTPNNLDDVEI